MAVNQDVARRDAPPDTGGGDVDSSIGRRSDSADSAALPRRGMGLSVRLLVLMLVFGLIVEVLVLIPAVTAFRRSWLNDRLSAAQIAALVLEATPDNSVPPAIEEKLLDGVGVMGIALSGSGARHLLSNDMMPGEILRVYDMRDVGWLAQMSDAMADIISNDAKAIRVIGEGMGEFAFVELIMDPAPLRSAMLSFAVRVAGISLLVWGAAAVTLYLALMRLIVRPVRRLAIHITAFEREPGNPARIIVPSGSTDEIGEAEQALARMERTLVAELLQQQRLAALGLAVAKISHELRNLLTAAQLISDRLVQVSDPVVERFAPRLIATLDRAITFCDTALSYGRVNESLPRRQPVKLLPLIDELRDNLGLADHAGIRLVADVPASLTLDVDPDQLSRALLNLGRNAVQALEQDTSPKDSASAIHTISISARPIMLPAVGGREAEIRFADDGPGFAPQARERLFEAFRGTTRRGGSGLGLPIASELIRLNGGSITLEPQTPGACFVIRLPTTSE